MFGNTQRDLQIDEMQRQINALQVEVAWLKRTSKPKRPRLPHEPPTIDTREMTEAEKQAYYEAERLYLNRPPMPPVPMK